MLIDFFFCPFLTLEKKKKRKKKEEDMLTDIHVFPLLVNHSEEGGYTD